MERMSRKVTMSRQGEFVLSSCFTKFLCLHGTIQAFTRPQSLRLKMVCDPITLAFGESSRWLINMNACLFVHTLRWFWCSRRFLSSAMVGFSNKWGASELNFFLAILFDWRGKSVLSRSISVGTNALSVFPTQLSSTRLVSSCSALSSRRDDVLVSTLLGCRSFEAVRWCLGT